VASYLVEKGKKKNWPLALREGKKKDGAAKERSEEERTADQGLLQANSDGPYFESVSRSLGGGKGTRKRV